MFTDQHLKTLLMTVFIEGPMKWNDSLSNNRSSYYVQLQSYFITIVSQHVVLYHICKLDQVLHCFIYLDCQFTGYIWTASLLVLCFIYLDCQFTGYIWTASLLVISGLLVYWLYVDCQFTGYIWTASLLVISGLLIYWLYLDSQLTGYIWTASLLVISELLIYWYCVLPIFIKVILCFLNCSSCDFMFPEIGFSGLLFYVCLILYALSGQWVYGLMTLLVVCGLVLYFTGCWVFCD